MSEKRGRPGGLAVWEYYSVKAEDSTVEIRRGKVKISAQKVCGSICPVLIKMSTLLKQMKEKFSLFHTYISFMITSYSLVKYFTILSIQKKKNY